MTLPRGLLVEQDVPVSFAPAPTGPKSAGDPPSAQVVVFHVLACGHARWSKIETDHTGEDGTTDWDAGAREVFIECVKAVTGPNGKRAPITVEDIDELIADWPEHAFRVLLASCVNLNRYGAAIPKVR